MVTGPVTDTKALAQGTFSDEVSAAQMAESDRYCYIRPLLCVVHDRHLILVHFVTDVNGIFRLGRQRAEKIKAAMQHTWSSYESKAFGADELKPRTGRPQNNWGGMGMTLLDSLDVLWIMGMKEEFNRARDWV